MTLHMLFTILFQNRQSHSCNCSHNFKNVYRLLHLTSHGNCQMEGPFVIYWLLRMVPLINKLMSLNLILVKVIQYIRVVQSVKTGVLLLTNQFNLNYNGQAEVMGSGLWALPPDPLPESQLASHAGSVFVMCTDF